MKGTKLRKIYKCLLEKIKFSLGEYKFRIKAVNNIGESDPLVGETILAKNPFSLLF